jgi:FMN-dependent oxidoreductase (nitrilotriacetate monooxygenase family)
VTSSSPAEAYNFGRDAHPSPDARYARAEEFVDVVRALWDSVDDGAYMFNKAEGIYADGRLIHFIEHRGSAFRVRGPLNVPRPPQGRPVIFEAGSSPAGIELAARTADVVFTAQRTYEDAKAFRETLLSAVSRYGRSPDEVRVLPGVMPFVGRTEAEARQKQETLDALIDPKFGLHMLSDLLGGADLSGLDPDQPLPEDLPWFNGQIHRSQLIRDMARRERLTLRQVYQRTSASRGHRTIAGTPARIADEMQDWFERGAADGFNILLPFIPGGLNDFVDLVVPELQRRGVFRIDYEGTTLRDHLGLPRPQSQFARAAATEETPDMGWESPPAMGA